MTPGALLDAEVGGRRAGRQPRRVDGGDVSVGRRHGARPAQVRAGGPQDVQKGRLARERRRERRRPALLVERVDVAAVADQHALQARHVAAPRRREERVRDARPDFVAQAREVLARLVRRARDVGVELARARHRRRYHFRTARRARHGRAVGPPHREVGEEALAGHGAAASDPPPLPLGLLEPPPREALRAQRPRRSVERRQHEAAHGSPPAPGAACSDCDVHGFAVAGPAGQRRAAPQQHPHDALAASQRSITQERERPIIIRARDPGRRRRAAVELQLREALDAEGLRPFPVDRRHELTLRLLVGRLASCRTGLHLPPGLASSSCLKRALSFGPLQCAACCASVLVTFSRGTRELQKHDFGTVALKLSVAAKHPIAHKKCVRAGCVLLHAIHVLRNGVAGTWQHALERSRPSIGINMRVVPFLMMLTARVTALTARQTTPRLSKTSKSRTRLVDVVAELLQRLQKSRRGRALRSRRRRAREPLLRARSRASAPCSRRSSN